MTTFVGNSISPFTIVNLDVFGRRIYRHLDLSATLYNLLNKTYYDPPSTAVPEAAIQQDGRTFRVQMTWFLGER
jgi:outer membrane receptor protein involved in Fe transport